MREKDKKNFIKAGIFLSLLTVTLMIFVISVGKEESLFEGKIDLKAILESAENLKTGAFVDLKGIRIGAVTSIEITPAGIVEVTFRIRKKYLPWIKKDTRVAISNAGLVGDKFLELKPTAEGKEELDPLRDRLEGEKSFDFKTLAAKGGSMAVRAERIMEKLETLVSVIPPEKLHEMLFNFHSSSHNFKQSSQHFPDMAQNFKVASQDLKSSSLILKNVSQRIENGPGTAHALMYDQSLYDDLRKLFGGAERSSLLKFFVREAIKNAPEKK
jgi:phospholipid/cholesterol/gamma-HCH transport system substrate-binding protein